MSVKFGIEWIDRLLPEGFPVNTSTLVSGPGSSGKPLIGYIFASGWLKKSGRVIFVLTSAPLSYLEKVMGFFEIDLHNYSNKTFFIELDPTIKGIEAVTGNHIRANFVKPEVWKDAFLQADEYLNKYESSLGSMVVGSALNLLYFSPTYRNSIHAEIKRVLENDKSKTYFLAVNSDAFKKLVEELEGAVDNLMFSRMEKPMKLYLKVARMCVPFVEGEVRVPISREVLKGIREEAEKSKKDLIPLISKL